MKKPFITICICTYKRPDMLDRLLEKIAEQDTRKKIDYSIVIVDNDKTETARHIADFHAKKKECRMNYFVESEQNISLARNKAIANSKGDYVALIDDDEFPGRDWLFNMYNSIIQYNADGILAPVLPHFEMKPPTWVLKGRFFERKTHKTGHVLDVENTRTGNALLKRHIFKNDAVWFDPKFGSGGEDRDFFRRQITDGKVFIWCNEAPVFETVPPERWGRRVLIKRAILRGKMALNSARCKPVSVFLSLMAITIYAVGLPFYFILGQHVFLKYLIKICDHLGKTLAFMGIDLIKEKYIQG